MMAFAGTPDRHVPVTTQPGIEGANGSPLGIVMAERLYRRREPGFFEGLGQLLRGQAANTVHERDAAFDEVVADLSRQAARRGADAVVGVQFERTHSGSGSGAPTHRLSAFGTAIRFGEPSTPEPGPAMVPTGGVGSAPPATVDPRADIAAQEPRPQP